MSDQGRRRRAISESRLCFGHQAVIVSIAGQSPVLDCADSVGGDMMRALIRIERERLGLIARKLGHVGGATDKASDGLRTSISFAPHSSCRSYRGAIRSVVGRKQALPSRVTSLESESSGRIRTSCSSAPYWCMDHRLHAQSVIGAGFILDPPRRVVGRQFPRYSTGV